MSLPKPDVHVRLDEEPNYWLRTIAALRGRPMAEVATEILSAELMRQGEEMRAIAQRLVDDGRVKAPESAIYAARVVGGK